MRNNGLPTWATVGATVWLDQHYSGGRFIRKATVTRVTNTSVFVKEDGTDAERRFIDGWGITERRLVEYGATAKKWTESTYLFALDSATINRLLAPSNY